MPFGRRPTARAAAALSSLAALSLACGPPDADWPSWASDARSTRYAPLDQIDAGNFSSLQVVWRWKSADVSLRERLVAQKKIKRTRLMLDDFSGTPLAVGGALYGITSLSQIYALSAATGEPLWLYDLRAWRTKRQLRYPKHRGIAYWRDGDDERILAATLDARLFALDARTGRPVEGFGDGGSVDLLASLRAPRRLARGYDYFHTSPPAIYDDLVIVGGTVSDAPRSMRETPGDIRAFDVRSGRLVWTFHTVPLPGSPGSETWEDGSEAYTGAANVWAAMSVDAAAGTVYAATSTPTNDYYGGHRPGDDLYAETLLCLDARTGERIWHQQLIRHGLWDWDLSAAPMLVDIDVDGRHIEAVVQLTKQAFAFVFDRRTGDPVWPIEDRPVPASDVPGERAAATQRFPTKPPPYDLQGTRESDLIDFTPELHAQALALFSGFRTGPLFTPPSIDGTLVLPGAAGGTNWEGGGFDPRSQLLFVPSITLASAMSVVPGRPDETDLSYVNGPAWTPALPFGASPRDGIPLFRPPWSRLTAIDLRTGEIRWQVANGDGPRDHPLLRGLDLPPLGSGAPTCVIVTESLLIAADGTGPWISATGEPVLRAYDKQTGEVVGRVDIPGRVRGCPMTYAHAGVQYIVLPLLPEPDPLLVALALPERAR